jgi:hypothetical protein
MLSAWNPQIFPRAAQLSAEELLIGAFFHAHAATALFAEDRFSVAFPFQTQDMSTCEIPNGMNHDNSHETRYLCTICRYELEALGSAPGRWVSGGMCCCACKSTREWRRDQKKAQSDT